MSRADQILNSSRKAVWWVRALRWGIHKYYGFHRDAHYSQLHTIKSGYEFKCRKQCSHWAMKTGVIFISSSIFPTLSQFSSVSTFMVR